MTGAGLACRPSTMTISLARRKVVGGGGAVLKGGGAAALLKRDPAETSSLPLTPPRT